MSTPACITALDEALISMRTALSARAVYWAEHASAVAPLRRAAERFGAALAGRESISVFFLPDRAIADGVELPSGQEIATSIGERVREHGAECLTVVRGIDTAEIGRLLDFLMTPVRAGGPAQPLFARLRLGGLRAARGGGQQNPGVYSAMLEGVIDAARGLDDVWTPGAPPSAAERRIEETTAGVLGLLAACRGGVVPLAALKTHDDYTYVHASNVAVLAGALAEAVGLGPEIVREITVGGLLHDVGKQRIPTTIINKAGKLDARELALVRQHPSDGARVLAATEGVPALAVIIAYEHHVRPDGSGYPALPPGRRPHAASQIVQLADIYDALGTNRPYRAAMTPAEIREVMGGRGKPVYNPELLAIFFDRVIARAAKPVVEAEAALAA